MRHLTSFATPDFPLHPSGARQILVCPWKVALRHMLDDETTMEESGAPADTGSAMHVAAAAFHRGSSIADSIEEMGRRTRDYPQADLADAAAMFLGYAQDPRNCSSPAGPWKSFPLIERTFQFSIAPHPTDPTGAPITIEMTSDHVVEDEYGRLFVRDIKTTKKEPAKMAAQYTYQVALYCIGVATELQRKVAGARLVFPRKYGKGPPANAPAHWSYPWGWDDLETIVEPVRFAVANMRRGIVHEFPTEDCTWCHQRSPEACRPAIREFRLGNPPLLTLGYKRLEPDLRTAADAPVGGAAYIEALRDQMSRLSGGFKMPGS